MRVRTDRLQRSRPGSTRRGVPRPVLEALAVAGIAGPVLFVVSVTVQGLLRPGYSHVAQQVSELAAGPSGWVQDATFLVAGLLLAVHAAGLHLALPPGRFGRLGPALLMLSGTGLMLSGAFPARDAAGAFSIGPVHEVGGIMVFVTAGVGLVVIAWRVVGDPAWGSLAGYAAAGGLLELLLYVVTGVLAVPVDGPWHPWVGLLQRATGAVWFACTIVLAARMRPARESSGGHRHGRPRRDAG